MPGSRPAASFPRHSWPRTARRNCPHRSSRHWIECTGFCPAPWSAPSPGPVPPGLLLPVSVPPPDFPAWSAQISVPTPRPSAADYPTESAWPPGFPAGSPPAVHCPPRPAQHSPAPLPSAVPWWSPATHSAPSAAPPASDSAHFAACFQGIYSPTRPVSFSPDFLLLPQEVQTKQFPLQRFQPDWA